MKKKMISNCCKADMTVVNEDEGTCYYACDKCKMPCDPYMKSKQEKRKIKKITYGFSSAPYMDIELEPKEVPRKARWERRLELSQVITSKMDMSTPMEVYPLGWVKQFIADTVAQARKDTLEEIYRKIQADPFLSTREKILDQLK